MRSPHSNEPNRRRSHPARSRSHSRERDGSKRHRANCWVSSKHHDQSNKSIAQAQPSPPTSLLHLPPAVLLPESMHPDSILTNPVIAELLHSLSPIQIKDSLDEFCNEVRFKQGKVRNIIGDLDEFLKRYIKGLSPVARETSVVVPATSAPIDSICERTAEELNVVPLQLIREKEEQAIVLSRVQDQLRISHRVINSLQETARTARLENDAIIIRARDSLLQCQKLRLQKEALMDRFHLLEQAAGIAPAPISSDDDDSIDTFKPFDLSPEAVQRRRNETKIYIKHSTGTELRVSKSVARDYHNFVPKCGIQMACFHSDWWWKGSQEGYVEFGEPLIMFESTLSIDAWKKGITTLVTIAYLQFAEELTGFDKDINGQYINSTLSRIQQWADGIHEIAQEFTKPGYPCNNPAESIVIIDAVDGLHDKRWAKTADKDHLIDLDKFFLLKLKTWRKVCTENNIQVTGKYLKYSILFFLIHLTKYYLLFSLVSGVHGRSCTHLDGIPRSAVQFLIETSKKTGEILIHDLAHPCRTGLGANNLTVREVKAFFESCVLQIVFYCFVGLVSASNKVLNQVFTFKIEEDATLHDVVRARCTDHKTTYKALLGLTNMSVSHSVATRAATRAATNAKISAACIGRVPSAETKAKILITKKANYLTKETKAKIMHGLTNMPVSRSVAKRAATKAKAKRVLTEQHKSDEIKAKRVLTEQHKNAISRGSIGKVITPEHRNEIRKSNIKEDNWHASLAEVVNFKKVHGHCNVPCKWKRDPKMGNWVYTQRKQLFNSYGIEIS